jgi:hypothetical protein
MTATSGESQSAWPPGTLLGSLMAGTRDVLLGLGTGRRFPAGHMREGERSRDVFLLLRSVVVNSRQATIAQRVDRRVGARAAVMDTIAPSVGRFVAASACHLLEASVACTW